MSIAYFFRSSSPFLVPVLLLALTPDLSGQDYNQLARQHQILLKSGRFEEAKLLAQQTLQNAEQQHNAREIANWLSCLGRTAFAMGNIDESELLLTKAQLLREKTLAQMTPTSPNHCTQLELCIFSAVASGTRRHYSRARWRLRRNRPGE